MKQLLLAKFTPSLMSPETLEAIFVQREGMAKRLVTTIRQSALTKAKHHTLVVGPRGMGKTHLVSLVYNRVQTDRELHDHLVVARLREEEWGVASFVDFLLRVIRSLTEGSEATALAQEVAALFAEPEFAEIRAERIIDDIVGSRTLLLIIENLDEVFAGIEELGQQKLRAFVQERQSCAILATAQSLFNGVSLQSSPFYGFFRVVHLRQLDIEDAVELLRKIAMAQSNALLADFISTPQGRARVRAIHHLAGGNPRVYVILSQFLSRPSLDTLVELFMEAMDDLTPYYQARMHWLSIQQRKIVEFLVSKSAVSVKDIAKHTFATHQTTSSQLKNLKEHGYVQSYSVGRESFYELREPLMRFALQMKRQQGAPMRIFIDFLRHWYSREELQAYLNPLLKSSTPHDRVYIEQVLNVTPDSDDDPRLVACSRDYSRHMQRNDLKRALQAAEDLVAIRGSTEDLRAKAVVLEELGEFAKAAEAWTQVTMSPRARSWDWRRLSWILLQIERTDQALVAIDEAIRQDPAVDDFWYWRAVALERLGRLDEALKAGKQAAALGPNNGFNWSRIGWIQVRNNEIDAAIESMEHATQVDPMEATLFSGLATVLSIAGRDLDAVGAMRKSLDLRPGDQERLAYMVNLLTRAKQYDEAITTTRQLVNQTGFVAAHHPLVLYHAATAHFGLGDFSTGITALGDALEKLAKEDSPRFRAAAVIEAFLVSAKNAKSGWHDYVKAIVDAFVRSGQSAQLGQGLVQSTQFLVSTSAEDLEFADSWVAAWEGAIQMLSVDMRKDVFDLPLRLIKSAFQFVRTRDVRKLLQLPSEERTIVIQLLEQAGIDTAADLVDEARAL